MHVLPTNKIPVHKVPLDVMIANKKNFIKKYDKRTKMAGTYIGEVSPVHDREEEAKEIGLMMIDEYPFEHAVFLFDSFNAESIMHGYRKAYGFLKLNDNYAAGLTIVVTPNWMFITRLYSPYHLEKMMPGLSGADLEDGVPVYLDGFAYAGIVNLQNVIPSWPESTGGSPAKKHDVISSLVEQSKNPTAGL